MVKYRNVRKGRRATTSTKKVIRKALTKSANSKIAKVCKRVIGRMAEVKSSQEYLTYSPVNATGSAADYQVNNIFMVSPNPDINSIDQGTGAQNRTGNVISTKRLIANIGLYPKPYTSTNNINPCPMIVNIWCVSAKEGFVSNVDMSNIFDNQFFQEGNSFYGYTSTWRDTIGTLNKDVLQVHFKRTYKLGHSTQYAAPNAASTVSVNNAQWSNNEYKLNHIIRYDLTKFASKKYVYNDGPSNVFPSNKNLFLIIGYQKADGTAFTSPTTERMLDFYLQVDYEFTDM